MHIAGFNPNSFVDYPENIAAVVFIGGCNLNCWYCHNRSILNASNFYREEEILKKIEMHKDFLDAVVITGGEPTLENTDELINFIKALKEIGLKIKLDTNGADFEKLKILLPLVDYVAMDIKAPLSKYQQISPIKNEMVTAIKNNIELLLNSDIEYEFRTTYAPCLFKSDIIEIAELIKGCKNFYLQQYVPINENQKMHSHSPDYVRETAEEVKKIIPCKTRGL
jgi:pyruvate formate lyase activating enzyme